MCIAAKAQATLNKTRSYIPKSRSYTLVKKTTSRSPVWARHKIPSPGDVRISSAPRRKRPRKGASLGEPYSTYYTRVRVINNGGTTSGGSSVLRSLFPTPFYVDYDAVSSFQPPQQPLESLTPFWTCFLPLSSPLAFIVLSPGLSFSPFEALTHNRLDQHTIHAPRAGHRTYKRCGPSGEVRTALGSHRTDQPDWSMRLRHVYRTAGQTHLGLVSFAPPARSLHISRASGRAVSSLSCYTSGKKICGEQTSDISILSKNQKCKTRENICGLSICMKTLLKRLFCALFAKSKCSKTQRDARWGF